MINKKKPIKKQEVKLINIVDIEEEKPVKESSYGQLSLDKVHSAEIEIPNSSPLAKLSNSNSLNSHNITLNKENLDSNIIEQKRKSFHNDLLSNFNITDELDRKIIQNVLNDNLQKSRFSFVRSEEDKSDDQTHKSDNSIKEILLNSLTQKLNGNDDDRRTNDTLKRKFSLNNEELEYKEYNVKIQGFQSILERERGEWKTEEKKKSNHLI